MVGACSTYVTRYAYRISIGKCGEKRPLGRLGSRWEHDIIMHIREMEWEVAEWMHLAQDGASGGLLRAR